jgi:segregation and condensation protein B
MLEFQRIKQVVEAALLCADEPLTIELLERLFAADECDKATLKSVLEQLELDSAGRGIELKRVASGYRFQVRQELAPWMSRMWEDRPPRYSRAVLETLALIAYKQPVTRGDIEQVRGVTVNSNMIRTLLERDWVRVVGYREVPGRPAMYGTTKTFLDYFNLKSLDELPTLPEIRALIEPIEAELAGAGPEYVEGPRVEFPDDVVAEDASVMDDDAGYVDAPSAEQER